MRVSMSATGSVSIASLLPAALRHARDRALVGELAQADPADPELLVDRPRPTAAVAAAVGTGLVLRRPSGLDHEGLLGHLQSFPSTVDAEREAEAAQQRACVLVVLRGRRDRNVQAPDRLDGVVVDLREDDLLADAHRVVAAAVERLRVESAEVADPG